MNLGRFAQQDHVTYVSSVESIISEDTFVDDVRLCLNRFAESPAESAQSEETHVLGNSDAEVVVAVRSVVTTSPGTGEVHTLDTVLLSYCPDYPAEFSLTLFDTGMSMRLGPKAHPGSTYSEDLDTTVLHIFLM